MNTPTPLDISGNSLDDGAPTDHQQDNSPNHHDRTDASPDNDNAVDNSNPDKNYIASATENDHQLPPDFQMYEIQLLTDEQKRHCIASYQSALTLFANQGSNNAMMTKDQYQDILYVCNEIANWKTLNALRHEGFPRVIFWNKNTQSFVNRSAAVKHIIYLRGQNKSN